MKTIYLLLLLFFSAAAANAQLVINSKGTLIYIDSSKWAVSGKDIYFKNTGNVGIGTNKPSAQLHTTGSVRFAGIGISKTNTTILTTDGEGNVSTRSFTDLLSGSTITSLNGISSSVQNFTTGTAGNTFNIQSSGDTHVFNLPQASATSSGALSSADWSDFNNKIDSVKATTPAAATQTNTNITINNTGAYWNAAQLQGRTLANTAPSTGQVLSWNGSSWTPATQTTGAAKLSSNFTTTSTTATNTNLSFAIGANESYYVTIEGSASKASTSTGMKVAISAPSGCTISGEAFLTNNASTALVPSFITAINTLGSTFATSAGTQVAFRLTFQVTNGSTAGNITLQAATVTSNTATIYAGTRMSWMKANPL